MRHCINVGSTWEIFQAYINLGDKIPEDSKLICGWWIQLRHSEGTYFFRLGENGIFLNWGGEKA